LRSVNEKKRRCRSRAMIQRPTTWTPTSTPAFALGYVQNGCDTPGRQRSEGFPCEAVS